MYFQGSDLPFADRSFLVKLRANLFDILAPLVKVGLEDAYVWVFAALQIVRVVIGEREGYVEVISATELRSIWQNLVSHIVVVIKHN